MPNAMDMLPEWIKPFAWTFNRNVESDGIVYAIGVVDVKVDYAGRLKITVEGSPIRRTDGSDR